MTENKLRRAWQEPVHADFFDARARYSLRLLRRSYESFNEFRLFLEQKSDIEGRQFVEIGCATGELYRYLRRYHPEFRYHGFDISQPAIDRARLKYPEGRFDVCGPDLSDVVSAKKQPGVVWARDVVLHQPDPFQYLSKLLLVSNEVTILRIRTRDKGATVCDPELSCQWHYNDWVPYMVLNVDETIERICQAVPVKRISIIKSYVQLGGWHGRFLPKECYYPETGTAETAVYIMRAKQAQAKPEIVISSWKEQHKTYPMWLRSVKSVLERLSLIMI